MNKIFSIFCLVGLLSVATACSDKKEHSVVGMWVLTTRTVDIPFDGNQDGVAHINLLKEIDCNKEETLTFEANGTVLSGNEFSNVLHYFKEDGTSMYKINSDCNTEGIISFASEYRINEEDTIMISNRVYVLKENTLTTTYKDAVEIYNEDATEVIETKDLKLIYSRP